MPSYSQLTLLCLFAPFTAIQIDAPRYASAFRSHNWVMQQMEMETELEASGEAQQLRQRAAQMLWATRAPAPAPAASALPPYIAIMARGQRQELVAEAINRWSKWQRRLHRRRDKRQTRSDATPSCVPLRLRLIVLPRLRSICGKWK